MLPVDTPTRDPVPDDPSDPQALLLWSEDLIARGDPSAPLFAAAAKPAHYGLQAAGWLIEEHRAGRLPCAVGSVGTSVKIGSMANQLHGAIGEYMLVQREDWPRADAELAQMLAAVGPSAVASAFAIAGPEVAAAWLATGAMAAATMGAAE